MLKSNDSYEYNFFFLINRVRMKLLPFAVAAIAAVQMRFVRAGEISPGVALISQKASDIDPLDLDDINTVIAAPVVAVGEYPSPSIMEPISFEGQQPQFSIINFDKLDAAANLPVPQPVLPKDPMVLVAAYDESDPNGKETIVDVKDIENSDVILLPEPLAETNLDSHLPGKWDEE